MRNPDPVTLPLGHPGRVKRLLYGVVLTRDTINITEPFDTHERFDIGRLRAGILLPFPTWAALLIVKFQIWRASR